jgi:hypothetical protein
MSQRKPYQPIKKADAHKLGGAENGKGGQMAAQ